MANLGIPTNQLAQTLAQRVQQFREHLGITQARLAETANMPLSQIQDIEAGVELFLSPAVRQKLARALKVRPTLLKAVEKQLAPPKPVLSLEGRERYMEEILHFPEAEHPCPQCGATLLVRIFHRRDLEDNPLIEVKAHCPKCLFRL